MTAKNAAAILAAILLLHATGAAAQLSFHDVGTNQGVLDQVVSEFSTRAAAWQSVVMGAAAWLFWTLGTISFTWTMGMLALKKADQQEFFAEFLRFILFFGFFYWLLQNGPHFSDTIIRSLRQIGDNAAGTTGLSPSGIVDVGFMIWKQAIANLSAWSPIDSVVGMVLSAGILLLLATIAVNMLLLLVSGWILMYAGIFFLGFGGSRWTSDMAINYFKTVLGVAVQLFAMVLLVGIGNDLLSTFYARMTKGTLNFEELGVMLVFCMALLLLVSKIPPLLAGVITGGGVGAAGGIGNFTAGAVAGAAIGAAGTAAAAAGMAGSAITAGALGAAGGAQALMAAFSKASAAASGGGGASELVAAAAGGGGSGGSDGPSTAGSGPLAAAMGGDGGPSPSSFGGGGGTSGGESGSGLGSDSNDGAGSSSSSSSSGVSAGSNAKGGGAPGEQNSGGSKLAKAGQIAAGTVGNLAQGSWDVAKAKAGQMAESFKERTSNTAGGQIAAAINGGYAASGGSLSAGRPGSETNDEVAAFMNKTNESRTEASTAPRSMSGIPANAVSVFD